MTGPSADHSASSLTPVRSSSAAGRTRSKLMSTITSVPPAMARAAGCSALMASASAQVAGRENSMSDSRSSAAIPRPGTETPKPIAGGDTPFVLSSKSPLGCWPSNRDHGDLSAQVRHFHDHVILYLHGDEQSPVIMASGPFYRPFPHDHQHAEMIVPGRLTVLLRALAETPELRLRVLVGEDALDRTVDGVFTTDLLDPRRYLTGGEIVLTGLMWRRNPADSEAFVAAVTAAGAMALAAGDAALGLVPDDLVDACRRHRLPLLEVPVDVSFAAITERVLALRMQPAGPGSAVARLRALAGGRGGAPGSGSGERRASLAEVLAVAATEYGVAGWVLSATGRLVAGGPAAPGPERRSVLARGWLGAPSLPATVLADSVPYSLFGVSGQPAHRLAGWFLAVAGDQAGWDADRRAIAAELAAVAAGHRARHEEAQRAARRAADGALRRVLDRPAGPHQTADPEIAAALRRCGLPR